MERLTKRLQELNGLCIAECEKECTEGYYECHKCKPFADVMKKLAEYEDSKEQGLLLRLPCKVGDTIYKIPSETNYRLNIANGYTENNRVYKQPVYSVQMWSNGRFVVNTCEGLDSVLSDSFGKTWFLTEEEAEQALKQMGE